MWLDGIIAAAAIASLIAIAAPGRGEGALAYPFGDVSLLILAAGATALLGRRAGRVFGMVALGLAACAVADAARLLEGVEVRAPLAALLLAAVAVLPRRRSLPTVSEGVHAALPAVFTIVALGVLVWDQASPLSDAAVALALSVPFLLVVRLAISLRENSRLLARSRDEAMTDALTGLGNRRALMGGLRDALEDGDWRLALFDLDGFKAYNDTFGHVAGDVLIEHLGGRLSAAVKGVGRAFRMGGDEFCVLVPGRPRDLRAGARRRGAARGGRGLPDRRVGGRRRPARRRRGRRGGAPDRRPPHVHPEGGPPALAGAPERRRAAARARRAPPRPARAHARGGGARPRARHHGGRRERAARRDHARRRAARHRQGRDPGRDHREARPARSATRRRSCAATSSIGEAIIAEAPSLREVARLVRASHERWDGGGYPDALAGEEIPLGARMVAICDAFSAMRQDRPYGEVLGEDEALDELRRGAGTQFDPALVAAFCVMRASSGPEPFASLAAPGERFIRAARLKPQPTGEEEAVVAD